MLLRRSLLRFASGLVQKEYVDMSNTCSTFRRRVWSILHVRSTCMLSFQDDFGVLLGANCLVPALLNVGSLQTCFISTSDDAEDWIIRFKNVSFKLTVLR